VLDSAQLLSRNWQEHVSAWHLNPRQHIAAEGLQRSWIAIPKIGIASTTRSLRRRHTQAVNEFRTEDRSDTELEARKTTH